MERIPGEFPGQHRTRGQSVLVAGSRKAWGSKSRMGNYSTLLSIAENWMRSLFKPATIKLLIILVF
ncbi:MAG TPA: hypothetical protein V6D15_19650 [Oculatellaceae cyanobacterium]